MLILWGLPYDVRPLFQVRIVWGTMICLLCLLTIVKEVMLVSYYTYTHIYKGIRCCVSCNWVFTRVSCSYSIYGDYP